MNELLADLTYVFFSAIIWYGASRQIYHIYKNRSARDFKMSWMLCLVASHFGRFLRISTAEYWSWYLCHAVCTVLTIIMALGVWKYRDKGDKDKNDTTCC